MSTLVYNFMSNLGVLERLIDCLFARDNYNIYIILTNFVVFRLKCIINITFSCKECQFQLKTIQRVCLG